MSFVLGLALLCGLAGPFDFELPDARGVAHRLSDSHQRLVVVAFIGTECPLARLYAPRLDELVKRYPQIAVVGINPNAQDSDEAIARFADELKVDFPILRDAGARVADEFGATRQLEVFLLDETRRVRYHGRIDDQFSPGARRPQPLHNDLTTAIDEVLADRPVSVSETPLSGCFIDRAQSAASSHVTYQDDIAPILARHCVECHRPGQIGPFTLTSYEDAARWAETIRERVADNKMPPWNANPAHGEFANDRRMSDRDKQLLFAWIDGGRAQGGPSRPPQATTYADGWNIGTPDTIVSMPRPIQVPAQGVLDYIIVELDPGFTSDTWIRGAEVRPGNRSVVHHCTVYIAPPNSAGEVEAGRGRYFCDFVPGLMPTLLPVGMARNIPAGWHIYFSLHYVPNGVATTDETRIGLVLTQQVNAEVFTLNLRNSDFVIPPFDANLRVEQAYTIPSDVLLLSLFPHMHLRGKSFRYEAVYPCGTTEVLLDVPRFDFMWQHRYILSQPKLLPAGTVLRGIATFDNSAANPGNPDPSATVHYGPQSTDEMFHGYFDISPIEQGERGPSTGYSLAAVAVTAVWLLARRAGLK